MHSLIIVLISLALLAALLYAGSSNINISYYITKSNKGIIESNAMSLATQFSAYENLKGYTLQETDWQNELFSLNRFTPKALDNTSWSYSNTSTGIYFCLSGNVNEVNYNSMKLAESSASDIAFTGLNCGSQTSSSHTGSFPTNFSVTYWIR